VGNEGGLEITRPWKAGLDEASAPTLEIDLSEPLSFLPPVDHAQGGEQEPHYNRHKSVNSGECVHQRFISVGNDGLDARYISGLARAQIFRGLKKSGTGAEAPSELDEIGGVEIATAFEQVLDGNPVPWALLGVYGVEGIQWLQREIPEVGPDDNHANRINEEGPVKGNEACGNMILLRYSAKGEDESGCQCYAQCHASYQDRVTENHVHQKVGCAPDDGQC